MEERKRRWRIKQNYNFVGVYSITNRTNGKVYVGSSTRLLERLKQHERTLIEGKHFCKAMQEDYDAGHHFQFDILESFVTKSTYPYGEFRRVYNLDDLEKKYIELYDCVKSGYNTFPMVKDSAS